MKGKFIPTSNGPLYLWRPPEKGEDYSVGVDSSEGIREGDPAAAAVVRMRDCALVAVMRGRVLPPEWGRKCARLAWLYGGALLAFETFPSAHGLSAARTAAAYGYPRLYNRVRRTSAAMDPTEMLGWHTDARTREMMVDRVREAVAEGHAMPCVDLLRELCGLRYNEKHRVEHPKGQHDDIFVAYAIALCVRDEAFARGAVRAERSRPRSLEDLELERYQRAWDEPQLNTREPEPLFDGIT